MGDAKAPMYNLIKSPVPFNEIGNPKNLVSTPFLTIREEGRQALV
jgi:hypothetical protein